MRGKGERSRVEELEDQVAMLRVFARGLFRALRARTAIEAEQLFSGGDEEGWRVVSPVFDAAQTIWERQRITIRPCRQVLDPLKYGASLDEGPEQPEMFVGTWPGGDSRNLTRDQVLMMAGVDPQAVAADQPDPEVPW